MIIHRLKVKNEKKRINMAMNCGKEQTDRKEIRSVSKLYSIFRNLPEKFCQLVIVDNYCNNPHLREVYDSKQSNLIDNNKI